MNLLKQAALFGIAFGFAAASGSAANAAAAPAEPKYEVSLKDLHFARADKLDAAFVQYRTDLANYHAANPTAPDQHLHHAEQLIRLFEAHKRLKAITGVSWKSMQEHSSLLPAFFDGKIWKEELIDIKLFMAALEAKEYRPKIVDVYKQLYIDGHQEWMEAALLKILKDYRKDYGTTKLIWAIVIAGGLIAVFVVGGVTYYFVTKRRTATKTYA